MRIIAADGSGLNIPTTEETLEIFGTSSRKNTKPQACIGLGCLYDVMNRGYPSTPAFIRMMDKNIYFLVRLKSSDYKKEQLSMDCNDKWTDIVLDKSRIKHYEGTCMAERMRELEHICLRMVKIYLDDDRYEVLLTNLPTGEFSTEQLADLYHMRWSIETAYETLKSRLQIENFTGIKPRLLLQASIVQFMSVILQKTLF